MSWKFLTMKDVQLSNEKGAVPIILMEAKFFLY